MSSSTPNRYVPSPHLVGKASHLPCYPKRQTSFTLSPQSNEINFSASPQSYLKNQITSSCRKQRALITPVTTRTVSTILSGSPVWLYVVCSFLFPQAISVTNKLLSVSSVKCRVSCSAISYYYERILLHQLGARR